MAAAPVKQAGAATTTMSSVVRSILLANGNNPVRLNALWEKAQAEAPSLAKSKSHFTKSIINNMLIRDELTKERVAEAVAKGGSGAGSSASSGSSSGRGGAGASSATGGHHHVRMVYGYRLKGTGKVRRIVKASLGIDVDWTNVRQLAASVAQAQAAAAGGAQGSRSSAGAAGQAKGKAQAQGKQMQ